MFRLSINDFSIIIGLSCDGVADITVFETVENPFRDSYFGDEKNI